MGDVLRGHGVREPRDQLRQTSLFGPAEARGLALYQDGCALRRHRQSVHCVEHAHLRRGRGEGLERCGWLARVAAEGNIKPLAQKRLRESKETLCGGRADCEQAFDDIVADYRSRYGRRATGMACRLVKRTPGLSIRISRGSRRVTCKFSRLLPASGILADADLEAVMGTGMAPGIGPVLATAYPGRLGFVVRNPRGPGTRRLRCPDLGD